MTTATIARAGFTVRRQLTAREEPEGYWVMFHRVREGKKFFWNGEWYFRKNFGWGYKVSKPQDFRKFEYVDNVFVASVEDCYASI